MTFRRYILPILLVLAAATGCVRKGADAAEAAIQQDSIPALGFWTEDYEAVAGTVRSGQTFSGLMTQLGMSSEDAYRLYERCVSVLDVLTLRAGNTYTAYYDTTAHALQYVVYMNDRVHQTVFQCADSLALWKSEKTVEHVKSFTDVTIQSSLWNDMTAAGASPLLISELSDIYAWTLNFFGLQKGDRFQVLYGERWCEGERIGIDSVYLARFVRDTLQLTSITLDTGDGGNIYWNERGESMRKAFLKAPLKYNRISSGFSYNRLHPVTGQRRAHTGVDYAAPTGTPVVTIGDGTVVSVGYAGAGGNTVKIQHNSVYTTAYLHLSKYAAGLKVGQRVTQGQVIGYVGMTGTATGPHLDFRVWQNGTPIDPLKMESPSAEPLPQELMPALDSVYRADIQYISERFGTRL